MTGACTEVPEDFQIILSMRLIWHKMVTRKKHCNTSWTLRPSKSNSSCQSQVRETAEWIELSESITNFIDVMQKATMNTQMVITDRGLYLQAAIRANQTISSWRLPPTPDGEACSSLHTRVMHQAHDLRVAYERAAWCQTEMIFNWFSDWIKRVINL